jgi:hypothetical protein
VFRVRRELAPMQENWAPIRETEGKEESGTRRNLWKELEAVSGLTNVSLWYQQVERRGRRSMLSNGAGKEGGRRAMVRTRRREKYEM